MFFKSLPPAIGTSSGCPIQNSPLFVVCMFLKSLPQFFALIYAIFAIFSINLNAQVYLWCEGFAPQIIIYRIVCNMFAIFLQYVAIVLQYLQNIWKYCKLLHVIVQICSECKNICNILQEFAIFRSICKKCNMFWIFAVFYNIFAIVSNHFTIVIHFFNILQKYL